MGDYRDLLERERRKFVMRDGTLEGLERRRNRKRRNGQIAAGVLALLIAAAGVGGGLFALRGADKVPPTHNPTPSPTTSPAGGQVAFSPVSSPLQFVDDQHGWVVVNGRIEATSDGGTSWFPQSTGSNVSQVQFINAEHGWAIAAHGLLRTVDGGATWGPVGERGVSFAEVQFYDAQHGWGIRRDLPPDSVFAGTVVKTLDGGQTWRAQSLQADAICSATDGKTRSAWAAGPGEGGILFARTTNGGFSWNDTPISVPEGEPWSASLQCFGEEVWVRLTDGGAAGHNPYGVFQSVDGAPAKLVMQEGGTRPFGHQEGVYESEDPYPGPFAAVGPGAAAFLNWCPACGGGPQVSVSITLTGGDPAAVTDRFPVVTGDKQGEPVAVSFLAPKDGEGFPSAGWALVNLNGPKGPRSILYETTDGGRTWAEVSSPGS
ncbi:MAG TPA: hypothetical protein VEQ37_10345 [Actinomycetota bacterium]|nr:hypothetical protein [Actinomycetota bacterium]